MSTYEAPALPLSYVATWERPASVGCSNNHKFIRILRGCETSEGGDETFT